MAEEKQIDVTVPGGRYEVNGKIVDADGNPVQASKQKQDATTEQDSSNGASTDLPTEAELAKMNKTDLTAQAEKEGFEITAEMDTNAKIAKGIFGARK